jgi:predicted ATPase
MAIDELHIKNYKSIRDAEIKLNNLNILIGANGVGKSNFLSFFSLLRAITKQSLPSFVAENGYADKVLYLGRKISVQLSGTVIFKPSPSEDPNNRYDFALVPDGQDGFAFAMEKGGYNINFRDERYKKPNWDYMTLSSEGGKNGYLGQAEKATADRFVYLREHFGRLNVYHSHDTSRNAALKQKSNIHDNYFLHRDGRNLAAFLYFIQEKHPANFRQIEYTVRSIAPFFDKFNLMPDKLNEDMIGLNWLQKDSDQYFNANDFSDGTLRFIALTTVLLQPNISGKIIIIDEPELGLHPTAIQKLAVLIKMAAQKTQIIIATQSVNLINHFEIENILVADRKNNQSVFARLASADFAQWLDTYTVGEIWEKNIIGGAP